MDAGIFRSRGLSMVELLIAMALGISLAAGAVQIYAGNARSARELDARIRMQESGRLALHFLIQALRGNGHPDCTAAPESSPVAADVPLLPHTSIRGWESAGTGPGDIYDRPGRPALVDGSNGGWLDSAGETMESLRLVPGSDVVRITDICQPDAAPETERQTDSVTQETLFYVGRRGNRSASPPALFRRLSGSVRGTEELFEGVESLQILYGIGNGAYAVANEVPDWEQVSSLRVSLLMQSVEDNLLTAPQPYIFQGVAHDGAAGSGALPGDRRLRQVFSTTIALRTWWSEGGLLSTRLSTVEREAP